MIARNSSALHEAIRDGIASSSLSQVLKLWARCQPYDRSSHSFKWSGVTSPVIGSIGFVSLSEFVSLDSIYMDYTFSTETPAPQVHCEGQMLDDHEKYVLLV